MKSVKGVLPVFELSKEIDDFKSDILEQMRHPKCRVVIFEVFSIMDRLLYSLKKNIDLNQRLVLLVPIALQDQIM